MLDARYEMLDTGYSILRKTGNVAATQKQLGLANATDSIQYLRITDQTQK